MSMLLSRTLLLMFAAGMVASCQSVIPTDGIDDREARIISCTALGGPFYYSRDDTEDSQWQAIEHNARWEALGCPGLEEGGLLDDVP